MRTGSSALALSLRRTWFDAFSAPAISILNTIKRRDGRKNIFHYGFTDLTVKFSLTHRQHTDFSVTMFMGKDNFKLGEERFDPDKKENLHEKSLNKMIWGNFGAILNYTHRTRCGILKIQPYISRAFSSDSQTNTKNDDVTGDFVTHTALEPSVTQAGMRELFSGPIFRWLYGEAGLQQTFYQYNTGNSSMSYVDALGKGKTQWNTGISRNGLLSAYGELRWRTGETVEGNFGARISRYLSDGESHWNFGPRFSLTTHLPHSSDISIGYSRIAQYAQQVSSDYIYLPSDAWLPTADCRSPLLCDILSLGYYKSFGSVLSIDSELWWKSMENLAEYRPGTSVTDPSVPWNKRVTFGNGLAYGLDMHLGGDFRDVTWNVDYGLMWNWRKFPDINSGHRYPAKFDNRHKVDIGAGWKINGRIELSGQWEYMTGNRTTIALYNVAPPDAVFPDAPFVNPVDPGGERQDGIDYIESRNNVRLPDFHRLNLNVSVKGNLNRRLSYKWDFGIYNAYCRMNPFTLKKDYTNTDWTSEPGSYREFRTLSLLPAIPSVSYTLYF